jgi:ribonuclease BN (tRNA processing enzyme)
MKMVKGILVSAVMASVTGVAFADDDKTAFQKVEGELSVMVLGSGGPIATAEGRASAGYLIFTDGKPRILMDVGGGTYQRLAESGTNIKDLDIVLLSHLHADHTGDLTPVIKTAYFHNNLARNQAQMKAKMVGVPWNGLPAPRTAPFNIYGPALSSLPEDNTGKVTYPNGQHVYPSTEDYADEQYSKKSGVERYLAAFVKGISGGASSFAYEGHDLKLKKKGTRTPIYTGVQTILEADDGLTIKYIPVDHGPVPSVAFRIEYKGHSIVYSGDTGSKGIGGQIVDVDLDADGVTDYREVVTGFGANNMATISSGADLLIYDTAVMEASGPPANPLFHALHTQPSLIAGVAQNINPDGGTLLLSHLTPVTSPAVERGIVQRIIRANGYMGNIEAAADLKVYNLGE